MAIISARFTETLAFRPPWIGRRRRGKQFAEGIVLVHRLPQEWSDDDYRYWWLPETDGRGHILRPARMDAREKARYQDGEFRNLITNAGRSQVLSYIGSSSGNTTAFAQYFAIGTGAIVSVSANDPALSNEIFRKAPATYSVSGTQVDINIQLGTTDAEATYTECGLFGNGASGTLGSGTLLTHALFAYTKGAYALAIDYIVNLL